MADDIITPELKKLTEEWQKEFNSFKDTHKQYMESIKANDGKEKELNAKMEKNQAAIDDLSKKYSDVLAKIQTPAMPETDEQKELNVHFQGSAFIKQAMGKELNEKESNAIEQMKKEYNTLQAGDGTLGGYLVLPQYERKILVGITQISPIRQYASKYTTSSNSLEIPKDTGSFDAAAVSELGTRAATDGQTFGMENLTCHEQYVEIPLSHQLLEDEAFGLEAYVTGKMQKRFAKKEATDFVTGNGMGKAEGFMKNAAVLAAAVASGVSAGLDLGSLMDLFAAIYEEYMPNARVFMRNATWWYIVKNLTDGMGRPFFMPSANDLPPGRIFGVPVVLAPDMAAIAASAYPIALGDLSEGYAILDKINTGRLLRIEDTTQVHAGTVLLHSYRRVGGQVVKAEAIKVLQCGA
jgi:HK97 family phage major capsid protein